MGVTVGAAAAAGVVGVALAAGLGSLAAGATVGSEANTEGICTGAAAAVISALFASGNTAGVTGEGVAGVAGVGGVAGVAGVKGTLGSCQVVNAAIAAWVGLIAGRFGSATENGDVEAADAETGEVDAGAASNGFAGAGGGTASKPKPSEGSAIWNGESSLRRSGIFAPLPASPAFPSARSSTTVNGESGRPTAVNGLAGGLAASVDGSLNAANGESGRFAD